MSILWIDFETRSRCDLKAKGVYNYVMDLSTEVLCMSYAFDDEEVQTYFALDPFESFPKAVKEHKGQIRAHNAQFERLVFQYVLGLDFKLEQFYCTATEARANCAPGNLEDAGRFAGSSMRKDHRGKQLIKLLCMPGKDGTFDESNALLAELIEYCEQDVRAMRSISKTMRQLTAEELADYHVNERINDRGILIDVPLAKSAVQYAAVELQEIQDLVKEITEGEVTSVRSTKMKEWVMKRVGDEALKLMEVFKDGEKKYSIDKDIRGNLLDLADEDPDEVPPYVADVIQCADDIWASSTAKFTRLAELADEEDFRTRGAFIFAGASATGRASSMGIQLHNMARVCAKDPQAVRDVMVTGGDLVPRFGNRVTDVLKGMIRPTLIPAKGNVFVVADWSAIEGRIGPWNANSKEGEDKLDQYRKGLDPYKVNAAILYNVPYTEVTKEQRGTGKVQELALSYSGTAGSFAKFAKVYRLKLSDYEVAQAISTWRTNNPWMLQHGHALESAIWSAMYHKNVEFTGCRTTYMFDGVHLWYSLPSGRILVYPFTKIENNSVTYARSSFKPKADAKEWPRGRLWMADYLNNTTQGTANCILRNSLRRLDELNYATVAHIHDEIVVEVAEKDADETVSVMTAIMTEPPPWAADLPLEVDINIMHRYSK